MTEIENNKDVLNAIEEYPLLSVNAKKVLKVVVLFDKLVSAESIIQASRLTKQVVYPALNKLTKAELVIKRKNAGGSHYLFETNKSKTLELLELYKKTKMIKNSV